MVDKEPVIVQDVLEDKDEEEVAASSPPSLSPHALPFFPTRRSDGRSKFRRWEEDLGAGSSDDEALV
jgi:hypothetical protein